MGKLLMMMTIFGWMMEKKVEPYIDSTGVCRLR